MDASARALSELLENRADYPAYRAIQLSEDISNQISFNRQILSGMVPPERVKDGHDGLLLAIEALERASAAVENYASQFDAESRQKAQLCLREYHNQRDIAVARISRELSAAGLVAHPSGTPIPNTSKTPPLDGKIQGE